MRGGVFVERTLPGAPGNSIQLAVREIQREQHIISRIGWNNLLSRNKELIQSLPEISDDGHAAGGSFEKAARWTVSIGLHRCSSDVQGSARGAIKSGMLRWGNVWIEKDVCG